MRSLRRFVDKAEGLICITTLIIMLTLTFANVLSRFILHFSLSFSEEIVTVLFVIASLTGSSVAVRFGFHLGLDIFIGFMPKTVQKLLGIAAYIIALCMCAMLLYQGVLMVQQEMFLGQLSPTMQWPEWIYGLTVPIGASILILRYIISIYDAVARFKEGD